MTKEQIAKKCIEKAVLNGYISPIEDIQKAGYMECWGSIRLIDVKKKMAFHINEILFDRSFAKAFWGKELVCSICGTKESGFVCHVCEASVWTENWKYEIQQLAIVEDRLEYMKQFIQEIK